MCSAFWWGKMVLIALVAVFFLVYGIETLIASFQLKNPLEFIMYFFSASLVIMVSLVGILYPAIQIYGRFHSHK